MPKGEGFCHVNTPRPIKRLSTVTKAHCQLPITLTLRLYRMALIASATALHKGITTTSQRPIQAGNFGFIHEHHHTSNGAALWPHPPACDIHRPYAAA